MGLQSNYTSNISKLVFNSDRIAEIKQGIFRPISMHFALTDMCNLNCDFCSNKAREGGTFELHEVMNILNVFKTLGAKSVEFTGGEPTLHPNINEIIKHASNIGYSIGMKSNGIDIKKHLNNELISKLTWLRISLNCLDYIDADSLDFANIAPLTTFGFSYVVHDKTDPGVYEKIKKLYYKYNAAYVRMIPDNSYDDKKIAAISAPLKDSELFDQPGFFWHEKHYSIPEKCWFMWLKPFINTDKNIYFCCATQMFERKFISKYRLCSTESEDIIRTWMHPKVYPGKMCKGGICYFKNHNELIQSIVEGCNHSDFI